MDFLPGTIGVSKNADELAISDVLLKGLESYSGLMGYRLPSVGVPSKEDIPSFVLIFDRKGIILVDVVSEELQAISEDEEIWTYKDGTSGFSRDIILDKFELEIINRLKDDTGLWDRRSNSISVPIKKVLVFTRHSSHGFQSPAFNTIINIKSTTHDLVSVITNLLPPDEMPVSRSAKIYSLLEGTKAFEKKGVGAPTDDLRTIGDFTNRSLLEVFKLDQEQRKLSMQVPQGPQRIRGLAGTGKTIILALKAALTHKDFKDYKILFVFNTQSMYNIIRRLISDYYTYETRREPDWSNLKVFHAWGGREQEGFYSNTTRMLGINAFSFAEVKHVENPYHHIFKELLERIGDNVEPIYDMVLIDEAQDFPQPFFEIVYKLTKPPKRIIWAYDEFQSLNELRIKEPDELFGKNKDGSPNMPKSELEGTYVGGIEKDFILRNSYRNPRMTLLMAHGIGLGIYRQQGIVDVVSDRRSWLALGYEVLQPNKNEFMEGDEVVVERPTESSKNILEALLKEKGKDEKSLVQLDGYPTPDDEYRAVAKRIAEIITTEKVEPEQIIVISLATTRTKEIFARIRTLLDRENIRAITPGYVEPSRMFQEPGFVTLATPFRAKGNEANVVFVVDSQNIINSYTFRGRSAAFVSITRSRGWTFMSGSGEKMNTLTQEYEAIRKDYPRFEFTYPSEEELIRRRIILSKSNTTIEKAEQQFGKLLEENPELVVEMLKNHPELVKLLKTD